MISGEAKAAYLYDASPAAAFKPVYLSSGVTDVRFLPDSLGFLASIVIVLEDGAYCLYDSDGKPKAEFVYSPNRAMKVEISGEDRNAFLYNTVQEPGFEVTFLNSGTAGVQFQADERGRVIVLLLRDDGEVNAYDDGGTLLDSEPVPQPAPVPDGSQPASPVGRSLDKSSLINALKTGVDW